MRKAILLSLLVLPLCAVSLFALDEGRQEGDRVVVEGCVYGANGYYALADPQGNVFQLSGDDQKFDRLVGHQVRMVGRSWFDVNHPLAMSSPNQEEVPTLHVFGVQHVSRGSCGE